MIFSRLTLPVSCSVKLLAGSPSRLEPAVLTESLPAASMVKMSASARAETSRIMANPAAWTAAAPDARNVSGPSVKSSTNASWKPAGETVMSTEPCAWVRISVTSASMWKLKPTGMVAVPRVALDPVVLIETAALPLMLSPMPSPKPAARLRLTFATRPRELMVKPVLVRVSDPSTTRLSSPGANVKVTLPRMVKVFSRTRSPTRNSLTPDGTVTVSDSRLPETSRTKPVTLPRLSLDTFSVSASIAVPNVFTWRISSLLNFTPGMELLLSASWMYPTTPVMLPA